MRILAIIVVVLAVIIFTLAFLGELSLIATQLERIAEAIEKY